MRKGAKATYVVFCKQYEVDADPDNADDDGKRRVARASAVFNVAEVDGYELPSLPERPLIEKLAHAEAFFDHLGIPLIIAGDQAFYRPSTDTITMPMECLFDAGSESERTNAWYAVRAHETTHAPGASIVSTATSASASLRASMPSKS